MAEVAPAAPPKTAKKKSPKAVKPGPSVSELIVRAVAASNEKNGVSLASVKKALANGGYDVDKNKVRVKSAVKKLVANGKLVQTKGSGASGSFKMPKITETKAKKPAAEKPATKAKKPTAAKKPKAAPKKVAAKKSPTKAKKPAAVKKTAAKKAAVKKPAVKKAPVAKKSPAKRTAKPKAKKTAAKK